MNEPFLLTERPSVYLASKSPRRQELLRQLGIEFTELLLREAPGRDQDIIEAPRKDEAPLEYVKRIARLKASVGWHRMGRRGLAPKPVLSADTEVVLEGSVLGKPRDAADAIAMLGALSGRTHEVLTAIAARSGSRLESAISVSQVTFRTLFAEEIARYDQWQGKAGAYAVQGAAARFVTGLRGSFSGVMGLPLCETAGLLERIGR